MSKKLNCIVTNKETKEEKTVGYLEIKNEATEEKNTELYIYGDIVSSKWYDDDVCAKDISEFLSQLDKYDDIDIYINSCGGSVFSGLAIYNQLNRHKGFKTVHIDGIAASIASVIACAGDKVIIPTSAQFMIHKPLNSYFWTSMNADDLRKDADILDTCQKTIANVYMNKTKEGVSEERINELINAETWFTGSDVGDYFNFEISEDEGEAVASATGLLNKYRNVPKDLKTKSFFNAQNQAKEEPKDEMPDDVKALLENVKSMNGYENFGKDLIRY